MLKWDFTITIGDLIAVLGVCGTIITSAVMVIRKMDQVLFYFREFPPHLHVAGRIRYPKGLAPDETEALDTIAAKGRSHA